MPYKHWGTYMPGRVAEPNKQSAGPELCAAANRSQAYTDAWGWSDEACTLKMPSICESSGWPSTSRRATAPLLTLVCTADAAAVCVPPPPPLDSCVHVSNETLPPRHCSYEAATTVTSTALAKTAIAQAPSSAPTPTFAPGAAAAQAAIPTAAKATIAQPSTLAPTACGPISRAAIPAAAQAKASYAATSKYAFSNWGSVCPAAVSGSRRHSAPGGVSVIEDQGAAASDQGAIPAGPKQECTPAIEEGSGRQQRSAPTCIVPK
jgi:hypothetical protein